MSALLHVLHAFLSAALLLLSTFPRQVAPASIPGFHECILNNRRYAIGEVFHPIVDVDGVEYEAVCYDCTCQPTTITQCQEIQCNPVTCENPIRLDGECCPICIGPDLTTEPRSCIYEGLNIPHGDTFHPPSMLQAYEENNSRVDNDVTTRNASIENPYCIECTCNDGSVECNDISTNCPALTCNISDAILSEGSCCMSCPIVPVSSGPLVGCYDFDGSFYGEGESWHPTLPGKGPVTCINCTCIGGDSRCQKLPCPPVPTCGPDDPIELEVLCCPKCNPPVVPIVTNPGDTTTEETPDLTPNITPCNTNSDYTIKVFKHPTLDAMAIEDTEASTVEVYSWVQEVNEDGETTVKRLYKKLSSNEFTRQMRSDYSFIGYTIPRRVNGLSSRESKRRKIEQCTKQCSNLVVNMLRVVSVVSCAEKRK